MAVPASQLSASDLAAWWGALVATAVLVFEVIKWRKSRAAVHVTAKPNMQLVGSGVMGAEKHILITATNRGGQPTTITHVIVAQYPHWMARIRGKPDMWGAIPDPRPGRLPHVLAPGEMWTGLVDQSDLAAKSKPGGLLYCGVNHALVEKPILVRVAL